ncbi:cupin domain-containing protein [Croceivirga thetidis]|uniref:Cupin domain-containing protein n=1 Tax=Croceivirga thetidis TaxID=2721623 RepID=A0ABX1GPD8_9FLAO|nr:cupin domain-containing protein [Croceivirga thetidis]NKI31793.1 cupin domain-containing protein [Croceivirga thetidis]
MNSTAKELIRKLNLKPHPEGGYFRETYRSSSEIPNSVLGEQYRGGRNCSTCIYFLLTSEKFSAFHRIKQDEIWHFYTGKTITLHVISESGNYSNQRIGNALLKDEIPQYVVKGGNWFAAEVKDENAYALVGCTVAPGFSYEDFELKTSLELTNLFPAHKNIIQRLTHA